jgi:hypothetical protein
MGEVSSIRGANTLFEGQQINGHTEKRREDTHREKRDTEETSKTQIKENPSSRSKMEQDCSETQRQRVRVHCKQRL